MDEYLLIMNLNNLYKSKASLGRFGDTELRVVNNELSHVSSEKILSQIDSQSVRKLIL